MIRSECAAAYVTKLALGGEVGCRRIWSVGRAALVREAVDEERGVLGRLRMRRTVNESGPIER